MVGGWVVVVVVVVYMRWWWWWLVVVVVVGGVGGGKETKMASSQKNTIYSPGLEIRARPSKFLGRPTRRTTVAKKRSILSARNAAGGKLQHKTRSSGTLDSRT